MSFSALIEGLFTFLTSIGGTGELLGQRWLSLPKSFSFRMCGGCFRSVRKEPLPPQWCGEKCDPARCATGRYSDRDSSNMRWIRPVREKRLTLSCLVESVSLFG